ncbi:MAG: methionine synthase [Micromonosporaceae bacterium]
MPGADPAEALRIVLGELPDLPHLPELPARGAGADMTGRTAALLVDMPVEVTATGWRFTANPGRDMRRARSFLAHDLDTLEEIAAGYEGPFKIQVCGPWTLAATIELAASQNPALSDQGAVRDLAASLAEGVAAHTAEVAKRLPGARMLLQIDEPALPAVLKGAVPTASGFGRLAPVEGPVAQEAIRCVIEAGAQPFCIVHCCAPSAPLPIIGGTGAGAVSFDLSLLRRGDEDTVAEAAQAGLGLLAGVVPAAEPEGARRPDDVSAIVSRVADLWRRLGLPAAWCAERVVLTPACGLAGASPGYARTALARCKDAARAVREEMER